MLLAFCSLGNWTPPRRARIGAVCACVAALGCSPDSRSWGEGSAGQSVSLGIQVLDASTGLSTVGGAGRYPLTAAPLVWAERQKLVASDGSAGGDFGSGVALDGSTALVGACGEDGAGAAYVFTRNADSWTEQQKIVASDGATDGRFGGSVALSANVALVGARGDSEAGFSAGAAYVFVRNARSWTQQQKLMAGDGMTLDHFGNSVALEGDTALVGAWGVDDAASASGAAYVFTRSATAWTERQKLLPSDGAKGDYFGHAVSLSGGVGAIGAPGTDGAGNSSGSVYVFVRTATSWSSQGTLLAGDGLAYDEFGDSVSVDGDTIIVGASLRDEGGDDSGAAYVFVRAAATWSSHGKLIANDGAADDGFGSCVSLAGDTAVIGSPLNGDQGNVAGAAYVFVRTATSWNEQAKMFGRDGVANDLFGGSVSLSGDTVLVGAPGDDDLGEFSGAAHILAHRLVNGQTCAGDGACASKACAGGVCCDSACGDACETCNAAGLEGTCTPTPRGGAADASCQGYLCNGIVGSCPGACRNDGECTSSHHCQDSAACRPRSVDGQPCAADKVCQSGHCVAGFCCGEACADGCGSCKSVGSEGVCQPVAKGHPGAPSCAPYLCSGSDARCPDRCSGHRDCASGHHCAEGNCQPDGDRGAACNEDATCASGHCTDGVCCVADSCGAYRCGAAGACEAACGSSAQCAAGHQCNSTSQCEPRLKSSAGEAGSCHLTGLPASHHWFGALGLLACLGVGRRRRWAS